MQRKPSAVALLNINLLVVYTGEWQFKWSNDYFKYLACLSCMCLITIICFFRLSVTIELQTNEYNRNDIFSVHLLIVGDIWQLGNVRFVDVGLILIHFKTSVDCVRKWIWYSRVKAGFRINLMHNKICKQLSEKRKT